MTDGIAVFAIISFISTGVIYIGTAIPKLVLHSKWLQEECPVETRLIIYLLYGGIADILWIILCIIAPCCGFKPQTFLVTRTARVGNRTVNQEVTPETGKSLGSIMLIIACISLLISFIFWCLGNAWILNKYQRVQYYNSTSSDYCYPPLFKGTFGIVIISDFWLAFFILTVLILYISN